MLTDKQKVWLEGLSNNDCTVIVPYDSRVEEYFETVKRAIIKHLGEKYDVFHKGATGLKISGQGELDVYIPVSLDSFNETVDKVTQLYGAPGSLHSLERARFVTAVDGTKVEVFVINKESESWLRGCRFENYLKKHPEALRSYEKLKEEGAGLSMKEYYTKKVEFINDILEKQNMDTVYEFLDNLDIPYERYEHPPVFTVEEAHEHRPNTDFWECKNLFLRNRKGDKHFLVTIHADKRLDLKALGEIVGEKVGFASPERLRKHLGLEPGSVSPFGLLNDETGAVTFILDKDAVEYGKIGVHPNINTQTLVMDTNEFKRAIESLENPFIICSL